MNTEEETSEAMPVTKAAPPTLPSIEELAANPPPRKIYPMPQPGETECIRAIEMQPGDHHDSMRRVFIAAKLYENHSAADRLVYVYLFSGYEWPVPVRAAVLASCPWALKLERRLAALERRRVPHSRGKIMPICSVA